MKILKKIIGAVIIVIFSAPIILITGLLALASKILDTAFEWWDPDTTWASAEDAGKRNGSENVFDDFNSSH